MTEYLTFEALRENHYKFATGLIYKPVFVMYLFYLYCYSTY